MEGVFGEGEVKVVMRGSGPVVDKSGLITISEDRSERRRSTGVSLERSKMDTNLDVPLKQNGRRKFFWKVYSSQFRIVIL